MTTPTRCQGEDRQSEDQRPWHLRTAPPAYHAGPGKMVDTTNDWIPLPRRYSRRHIGRREWLTSDLAVEAAKKALAQRGLAPSDMDAIIVGTVTPDMFFPSTACLVQHKLGATGVWGFDISAACSLLLRRADWSAIHCLRHPQASPGDWRGCMSSVIDYTDRASLRNIWRRCRSCHPRTAEDDSVGLIDFITKSMDRRLLSLHARRRQPESVVPRNRGQEMHYVHQDGQQVFQVRRAQANRSLPEAPRTQWP